MNSGLEADPNFLPVGEETSYPCPHAPCSGRRKRQHHCQGEAGTDLPSQGISHCLRAGEAEEKLPYATCLQAETCCLPAGAGETLP